MKKEYTHNEFLQYIKENGITEAITTQRYYSVPAGTKLYFGYYSYDDGYISSYNKNVNELNRRYGYDFDYQWYWNSPYTCKFIIVEKSNNKITNKLKNNTMKLIKRLKEITMSEPLKSLVDAGIKNDDDTLTEEGKDVLLDILAKDKEKELKDTADKINEHNKQD